MSLLAYKTEGLDERNSFHTYPSSSLHSDGKQTTHYFKPVTDGVFLSFFLKFFFSHSNTIFVQPSLSHQNFYDQRNRRGHMKVRFDVAVSPSTLL